MKKGTLLIDSSTIDPSVSKEMAVAAEKMGAVFMDAPVSGGNVSPKELVIKRVFFTCCLTPTKPIFACLILCCKCLTLEKWKLMFLKHALSEDYIFVNGFPGFIFSLKEYCY